VSTDKQGKFGLGIGIEAQRIHQGAFPSAAAHVRGAAGSRLGVTEKAAHLEYGLGQKRSCERLKPLAISTSSTPAVNGYGACRMHGRRSLKRSIDGTEGFD
jgi:hypothetical protein